MVAKVICGHNFVFYDNIEDLPITQFHRYSKYALVESGVGDTLVDIDRHITRIINFLTDTKKAYQELMNLRQSLYFIATEQDIHNKATLCLVKSVDGVEWSDFSDSGLDELYKMIGGERIKEMNALADDLRRKIDDNLMQYFPSIFEDATQKNYADLLRKRAILQIGEIMGDDNSEKIKDVTKKIYSMQNPKCFTGVDSEEIRFDKQFEDMCLLMAKEFGGGIKKYTTMEFYTALERLEKQNQEIKKIKNRRK